MTNTVNQQPAAASLQLTDYLLAWQGAQSPPTRKLPVSGIAAYYLSLTGGTLTGNLTVSSGGVTVTGNSQVTGTLVTTAALTVQGGGLSVTGNSSVTGTLSTSGALTVSGGGAAITGNSSVTGTLGVSGTATFASANFTLVQAGSLSALNSGSGCVVVEANIAANNPAVYVFNRFAAASAVSMVVRNDRTDGFAIAFSFGTTTVGSITQNGSTTAYNTTSDANLKIRIGEIAFTEAARVIEKLAAVWFNWKQFQERPQEPGFFAQEVYKICPWAVTKGRGRPGEKNFRPWQMDAAKLMPFVVAYVQGIGREQKAQAKRLAALEAR